MAVLCKAVDDFVDDVLVDAPDEASLPRFQLGAGSHTVCFFPLCILIPWEQDGEEVQNPYLSKRGLLL